MSERTSEHPADDEVERLRTRVARARRFLADAVDVWEAERRYFAERAERKRYSSDETAAEVYGAAIEAVSKALGMLDGEADRG